MSNTSYFMYFSQVLLCVIVICIISLRVSQISKYEPSFKAFNRLLLFVVAFLAVDGTWGLFTTDSFNLGYYGLLVSSYLFHLMAATASFTWCRFFLSKFVSKDIARWLRVFLLISYAGQLVILFTNIFTKGLFDVIDAPKIPEYVTGPMRPFMFGAQCISYGVLLGVALMKVIETRHRRSTVVSSVEQFGNDRIIQVSFFCSFVPFITAFLQMFYPFVAYYSAGFMVCILVIYIFVISEEYRVSSAKKEMEATRREINAGFRKEYGVASMVSEDYEYLGMMVPKRAVVRNYLVQGNLGRFFPKTRKYIEKAEFMSIIEKLVSEKEYEVFSKLTNDKVLKKELHKHDKYIINTQLQIDSTLMDYQIALRLETEEGKPDEDTVVIGIKNIDKEKNMLHETDFTKKAMQSIADSFFFLCRFDLINGTRNIIKWADDYEVYKGNDLSLEQTVDEWIRLDIYKKDIVRLLAFTRLDSLKKVIKENGTTSIEIKSKAAGWLVVQIVPIEFDENGEMTQIMWMARHVDSHRAEELETEWTEDDEEEMMK